MRRIAIVGHEASKFTPEGERQARGYISDLLAHYGDNILVSGACPLGGIDIWAEEEADALGVPKDIYGPTTRQWDGPGGFKERNLKIAQNCDECHCIVVNALPSNYTGRRFELCYHCGTRDHIKSGGCWTARRAKTHYWHIVDQRGAA